MTNESVASWHGDSWFSRLLLGCCRRIPHFRGKGRLFQLVAKRLMGGTISVHNDQNVRIILDPTDYIGRTISFEGSFEPKSIARAMTIMREGGLFLDVGCNFGLYTLSVGVLPNVKCVAIDASFVALAKLNDNLARNPGINVRLVSCALGRGLQLQRFHVAAEHNLGSTRIAGQGAEEDGSFFWAASSSLQSVLERLSPGRIRLLKIDVEGSEQAVFESLDFDGPYRPVNIIVECYTDEFPEANTCFEFVRRKGYEALNVDGEPIVDCLNLIEQNVWFRDRSVDSSSRERG